MAYSQRLLSPLRSWDGLSSASLPQPRPNAGRYVLDEVRGIKE